MFGNGFLRPLISPPGSLFIVGAAGWLVRKRRPRLGRALIVASIASIYLLSTPLVSAALLIGLQRYPPVDVAHVDPNAKAIVVLGGDQRVGAEEFMTDATVSMLTLERVRYAAFLAKKTHLPILTSGGTLRPSRTSLALLMKRVLEDEFGASVKWVEDASGDTHENAVFSAAILKSEGIDEVLLVTHAWHMPRAVHAFEAAGLRVIAAPTAFRTIDGIDVIDFMPSSRSLHESALALHEWLGGIWYAISG